jgi:hypothetical protein
MAAASTPNRQFPRRPVPLPCLSMDPPQAGSLAAVREGRRARSCIQSKTVGRRSPSRRSGEEVQQGRRAAAGSLPRAIDASGDRGQTPARGRQRRGEARWHLPPVCQQVSLPSRGGRPAAESLARGGRPQYASTAPGTTQPRGRRWCASRRGNGATGERGSESAPLASPSHEGRRVVSSYQDRSMVNVSERVSVYVRVRLEAPAQGESARRFQTKRRGHDGSKTDSQLLSACR